LARRKNYHFETERQHKNGLRFPVSFTVSPIRDGQNVSIGTSKIIRDLSERERRRAMLTSSETALAASRAETEIGAADLLVSKTELASSRADAKIRMADLLAAVTALAASRAETEIGAADLLVSKTELASHERMRKLAWPICWQPSPHWPRHEQRRK
jgi:hypothetical protein